MSMYRVGRGVVAALAIFALTLAPPRHASASGPASPFDFDGDGYADLAVGVAEESGSSGIVQVIYGSSSGLAATGDQVWSHAALGMPVPPGAQLFGFGITSADYDADGWADLAVSAYDDALLIRRARHVGATSGSRLIQA